MNASTKKVSASGYDITPIPTAERDQLAARLTPEERYVLFEHGTERPFCGGLLHEHGDGVFACRLCGLPLFKSVAKFESGTGWPSFYEPFDAQHVREIRGARRVVFEIRRGERFAGMRRGDAAELDEIVRCADAAHRREQERIGCAEQRDARGDADRERERREHRESRIRRELARGMADVLRENGQHAVSPWSEAVFGRDQAFARAGRMRRWSSSWRRRCIVASSTTRPSNMKIFRSAKSA